MTKELAALAEKNGYKLAFISLHHISGLRQDLEQLRNEPNLHENQTERIDINIRAMAKIPQKYTTIIIVAVPRQDQALEKAKAFFIPAVKEAGFSITIRQTLPLKRLAVQSGLAEYGRNNITYVKGMGSRLILAAFLTDLPCEDGTWAVRPVMSAACDHCDLCIIHCPTGAIGRDRFLLHREKCKNCPVCQDCCPMNAL